MDVAAAKRAAASAALDHIEDGIVVGVGTGTSAAYFIEALGGVGTCVAGAVASSEDSARKLAAAGVPIAELPPSGRLPLYVDGADEIDPLFRMVKGGGGAHAREKVLAAASETFICMAAFFAVHHGQRQSHPGCDRVGLLASGGGGGRLGWRRRRPCTRPLRQEASGRRARGRGGRGARASPQDVREGRGDPPDPDAHLEPLERRRSLFPTAPAGERKRCFAKAHGLESEGLDRSAAASRTDCASAARMLFTNSRRRPAVPGASPS